MRLKHYWEHEAVRTKVAALGSARGVASALEISWFRIGLSNLALVGLYGNCSGTVISKHTEQSDISCLKSDSNLRSSNFPNFALEKLTWSPIVLTIRTLYTCVHRIPSKLMIFVSQQLHTAACLMLWALLLHCDSPGGGWNLPNSVQAR